MADSAYQSAKAYLERSGSLKDQEKLLLVNTHRIEDVQEVVLSSLAKYETKHESSKARKWLQRTSEMICHYGTILDVFVQHHPEYVSLVWGFMKLLFIVSKLKATCITSQ